MTRTPTDLSADAGLEGMNSGRMFHDIADLLYSSPGFIGSVSRSRATAREIMKLVEFEIYAARTALGTVAK
jgi:hypothetical protein